jgi:UDP-glucuronate 4-epimerase
VTRVVHLAGLQVPFCRENPPLGASVNVVGTVNVLEAVKRRRDRIPGVAYASSAAVYGPHDPSPAPEAGGRDPLTHYGVTKLANEGAARVFWQDDRVPSIGIRPYVVYGPGRDQGLTSGATLAMAAAARGEGYHIGYGGTAQYDYAPDVSRAFVTASHEVAEGALVANYPGVAASMRELVGAIEAAAPEVAGALTWDETPLPFPSELEATALERTIGPVPRTPLDDGVAATVATFRALASS